MEEAEELKKEIMTVARGLGIKREDSGKKTEQGSDELKSRGRRFIIFTWGEKGGRKIQEKNI